MFGIQRVTIDYLENPVGILGSPQFAWSMESDRKNVIQTAYRLQIAKDGDFSRPVYDSEKRETEQSAQDLYPRCRRPVSGKAALSEWRRPLTKKSPKGRISAVHSGWKNRSGTRTWFPRRWDCITRS